MDVEPKIGGKLSPKMDGENNGKTPYFLMDDLGVPLFLETPMSTLKTNKSQVNIFQLRVAHKISRNFLTKKPVIRDLRSL